MRFGFLWKILLFCWKGLGGFPKFCLSIDSNKKQASTGQRNMSVNCELHTSNCEAFEILLFLNGTNQDKALLMRPGWTIKILIADKFTLCKLTYIDNIYNLLHRSMKELSYSDAVELRKEGQSDQASCFHFAIVYILNIWRTLLYNSLHGHSCGCEVCWLLWFSELWPVPK